ncbi:MAG: ketose-bisphosphate aldolase [Candidatus Fusobacterium pullicola]|jgi:fructose-bisphosphate aldolase class II|uniref:Ketose-bisphosphate aldolase n=1 Tax=Candidatus Fusobacterium pullicola TaxID=2838601 RepID=A0A9E2NY07_9FUSO|nr:ketose-bisphosphate aldolase [Candidatus Fusobacterium pullicola]
MLMNMKELLQVAQKEKFAVGAYNIGSAELLKTALEECEANNAPIILAIHPSELEYLTDEFIEYVKVRAMKTHIPAVIHLDHGGTKEQVIRAIRCGFTSVMIDASHYSFEENVRITKEIVEIAKPLNVSVEAELGTIGNLGDSYEGGASEIIYTDPVKARELVERTGIDTLAVAIGTSHGLYPKWMTPKLNLELLKEIKSQVGIPLVLHGGSANPDNEIAESVKLGICKINISSDIKSVFFKKVRETLKENEKLMEPHEIFSTAINEAKKVVKHKLELFNCIDKARLY